MILKAFSKLNNSMILSIISLLTEEVRRDKASQNINFRPLTMSL